MQEGVSKGGNLSHAMFERTHTDHSSDYRTPATTSQQQSPNQQQVQQHEQSKEGKQNTSKNSKNKNQVEERTAGKQNKGAMAKDIGATAKDELDGDNHSLKDLDEEDDTSLEEEIQKVANIHGLSPKGIHHDSLWAHWSNKRGIHHRIWKRLDRALVNDKWLEKMPQTTITHLPSVGSDHCPLLMEMSARKEDHIRYFKFLNCWPDQPNFLDTVKACWDRTVEGCYMWKFHQKLKRLSNTLSSWSGEFGDIFVRVKEYEEKARNAEENLIQDHTEKK
ncbi:hypothetical protein H5410_046282 [Solanum commersonii]|uniref:Uncharacterized protein n=1 Tax=Solanum commersonii TaxID=4109 RepID=A0A9J5XG23_SOLCO|nr:hypothetical protein H5410_046282 [Solanum commersonii]